MEARRSAKRSNTLAGAAPDVLLLIFSRLPPASLASCSSVCTAWQNVINNSSLLWERAYVEQAKELRHRLQRPNYVGATDMDFKTRGIVERQRAHLVQGRMHSYWWKAHSSRVDCCRMNMDSIVSGSADQTVRLWSAKSRLCLEEFKVPGNKRPVVDLEFDENKIVGAAGSDVWVWNRNRGGRITHKMGGHGQRLHCLCYSEPEVAVGCSDGSTCIYDMYSGRCSRIFRNHSEAVTSVSIQEETQMLASGSRDGSVQVCDSSSGETIARLLRPTIMREVGCLQWGVNSDLLYAGTSVGRLCCWDMRKQDILWQEGHDKSAMASLHLQNYAPATVVSGSMDGRVRVWDSISGMLLNYFRPISYDAETPSNISLKNVVVPSLGTSTSSSASYPIPFVKPILCLRVGTTRVLTSHTDGTLTLCQFRIQNYGRQWNL